MVTGIPTGYDKPTRRWTVLGFSKMILEALKASANMTKDTWDQYVKVLEHGLNNASLKTIKEVSIEILLGYTYIADR